MVYHHNDTIFKGGKNEMVGGNTETKNTTHSKLGAVSISLKNLNSHSLFMNEM